MVGGAWQATVLKWVAMPSSMGSSQPRARSEVSRIAGRFFTVWATGEALRKKVHRHERSTWRRAQDRAGGFWKGGGVRLKTRLDFTFF